MTNAFSQIRLTNTDIQVDGNRLKIGNSGVLYSGENYGGFINTTNLIGLANSGQFVSGISVTGGVALQNAISITGVGGLQIYQYGNNIHFSGGVGSSSTSVVGVTGISVTGGIGLTGLVSITGIGGINVYQFGNEIRVSGLLGDNLPLIFDTYVIPTGSENSPLISFSTAFARPPIVIGNLINKSGQQVYGYQISGIATNGFYINFSETVDFEGYSFNYLATTGSGFLNLGANYAPSAGGTTDIVGLIKTGEVTGIYYLINNPNQFISSGDSDNKYSTITNLNLTGINSLNRDITLSGNLSTTGTTLLDLINVERNKNTITGTSISGSISITGALNINAGSNITLVQAGLNTFSIASTAAGGSSYDGVTGISVTGGNTISGALLFNRAPEIVLDQQGTNIIKFSTSGLITTGNGNLLYLQTGLSGNLVTSTNGTVSIVGGATIVNGQLLIGESAGNSFEQGNLISSTGTYIISGSGSLRVAIDVNVVITGKEQVFKTAIASGVDNAFISFSSNFASIPFIFNNVEISGYLSTSPFIYGYNISGLTTSGYTIIFSDTISETGVILHTLAKLI